MSYQLNVFLYLQVMDLQDQATVIILLRAMAQDLLDHQAAQIITLLHLEDILLRHIHLAVHQDLGAKDGLHNSRALWGLQVVHQMDLLHHHHQVLMICTTIDLVGLNQGMEVHDLHIQVKIPRVIVLLQELLLVHHQVHLRGALILQAHILAKLLEDHRYKAKPLILANHHTKINSRYVENYVT